MMHTWRISALVVLYCLTILSTPDAGESRFLRVVRQFKNATYAGKDRDLLLDFSYDAKSHDQSKNAAGLTSDDDARSDFQRTIEGNVGAELEQLKGTGTTKESRTITFGLSGNYDERADTRTNQLLGRADTNQTSNSHATLYANYQQDYERHFGFARFNGQPFWALGRSANFTGWDERECNYSSGTLQTATVISKKEISQSVDLSIGLQPEFGYGWQSPVWPVYYAFEVERKLKECGALRGELSDQTLLALANHCASQDAYQLNHDKSAKFFMGGLDSIIRTDTMADLTRATMFTAFKVREAISDYFPHFFVGFRGALYLDQDICFTTRQFRQIDNANPQLNYGMQYPAFQPDFNQDNSFGISLQWGIPITERIFASIRSDLPIGGNNFKPTSIRDKRNYWGIELFWFVTDRILVSGGITDMPSIIIVPCDWPRYSYFRARYFIEDRISINLTMSKGFSNADGADLISHKDFSDHSLNDRIIVGFDYDF
jgi:hypothetical protein